MTIFGDLQAAYGAWQQARNNYRMNSFHFMRHFADAFRKYVGAPEQYIIDQEQGDQKPYVDLLEVSEDEEGNFSFAASRSPVDALSRCSDGFWQTGIGLVVDRNINSYPKAEFYFPIKFVLRGTECEMIFLPDNKFTFSADAVESQTAVFDYIVGVLEELLSTKPWETTQKAFNRFFANRRLKELIPSPRLRALSVTSSG
jgi:hypothetical protein